MPPEKQMEIISAGAVDLIQKKELLEKLREGRPLRVKAGLDPSRPDLHIGHGALINKLRQFQDLGHEIIFIVGDFTARIGDPSGQNKTRPLLTEEEVKANAKTYIDQATAKSFSEAVIREGSSRSEPQSHRRSELQSHPGSESQNRQSDLAKACPQTETGGGPANQLKAASHSAKAEIPLAGSGDLEEGFKNDQEVQRLFKYFRRLDPGKTKALYNSEWLGKVSLRDFLIDFASHLTVARQLERNDFSERHKAGKPIALHEFFYPALQAMDSLELKADVEIGGTDQLFNLLLGREIQERFGQRPQSVLTLPLLKGTDGSKKMSKSLDNAIGFNDPPKEIFGKIMKISDNLMEEYWRAFLAGAAFDSRAKEHSAELPSARPPDHPKARKEKMAFALAWSFHGRAAAEKAREEFCRVFSGKGLPDSIPEKELSPVKGVWICALLKEAGLFPSSSEARRRIEGGGAQWDGKKLSDPQKKVDLKSGQSFLLSAGRRKFIRVKIK